MLKRLGIPLMALAGFVGFGAAQPALAGAHFGFSIGTAPPAYCSVYDPYYCPYGYSPYGYAYPGVGVYPYTYTTPGFGLYFGGGHEHHERNEHHEAHGHQGHEGHEHH